MVDKCLDYLKRFGDKAAKYADKLQRNAGHILKDMYCNATDPETQKARDPLARLIIRLTTKRESKGEDKSQKQSS